MLGTPLRRPDNAETTALGAAYLAGLSTGFWKSTEELAALREGEDRFLPTFDEPMRAARLAAWHEAVSRASPPASGFGPSPALRLFLGVSREFTRLG